MAKKNPKKIPKKTSKKSTKEPSLIKKIVIVALIGGLTFAAIKAIQLYNDIRELNVNLNGEKFIYIYIPTGSDFKDVTNILYENNVVIDRSSFEWVAEKKGYTKNVKPGKYKITSRMTNNSLVNLLRSGNQEPVRLVFNKVRTKEKFAELIGNQIEAKSSNILSKLNDKSYLKKFDKKPSTALTLFIPNTYEFYWNTSTEQFMSRMHTEYEKFWTDSRKQKAANINLTPDEVFILASIVEEETVKNDEKPEVAGVYINRLKKGMRLQADPTVKFAVGDFELKRVLTKHLEIDNPYNTYKYEGLPPGPICIPTLSSIDAVLNYKKHSYLYFCAKDDFSGYHAFAKTLIEHNQNAEKYRDALNRNRIYK